MTTPQSDGDISSYHHIRALVLGLHESGAANEAALRLPFIEEQNRNLRGQLPAVVITDPSNLNENKNIIPPLIIPAPNIEQQSQISQQQQQQHNDLQSPTPRRFSQFNFGLQLRRFSHSNVAINRVGEPMGSVYKALLQYVESNDLFGLKTFLDTQHPPVDDRDENGTTVLMVVAGKGLAPFVREFLARGADVQAEDLDNWNPLLFAVKHGHFDVIQMLLEHGAEVEHREMGGWTALMWASYKGHTEIVQLLLERGAEVNTHGNYHLSPLLWAAGRGHKDIVQLLVQRGAKVNVGDKYGTTALVWACRKGSAEIVEILLRAGANADTAGMYSWTPLLVATSGGHVECVSALLEKKPNVNALDKDGMTCLSIACREGYQEIAAALMSNGAYINIQDRANDTPLIHAVKGGHRTVVEALLKKHADLDIQGKERKTALYTAVEKGHTGIVKLLLSSNPDLELATKDGDTPLLRGVRNRNKEIVDMLLDRRAKVSACDKRGDTCLHIAMRARSRAIVESLLRNPKNSQLLYRANKAGETPYTIDTNHQKTILGQVYGSRKLNTNEDSEGMLGYELYSSALADVLSEPTLTMPITVGLYAKWGSGKSFLLTKLREEMNNFARQWREPPLKSAGLLFFVIFHLSMVLGMIVGLSTLSIMSGTISGVLFLTIIYMILWSIRTASDRYDVYWAYSFNNGLLKRLGKLRLILQVAFCHPPGPQSDSQAKPVRFHFAEASSASPTGEGAVGSMLSLLFEAVENHYGWLSTRLYRAFRPKPIKSSSGWRWRRMCCIPVFIIFEFGLMTLIVGISLVVAYFSTQSELENKHVLVSIYVIAALLATAVFTNLHIWAKALKSLFISQGRHLRKSVRNNEGAPLSALGAEVALMADMVKCLDAFTSQQSRLVGVVDALDSCDTERILSVLNAIQTLLSSPNRPFVLLIAVDPHVIAKAAEANSRRLFTEGGIGGHDFLRNLVHLPVYLQNSGLRKVERAQKTAIVFKRSYADFQTDEPSLTRSVSARRLSNASEIMSSQEKLRAPPSSSRGNSKKLRVSDSIASSIGSNLHRLGQNPTVAVDLTKIMLTDDYFSDVNPRSIRRLMNVVYITVRLLKAFQIEFSWYRLSSWINLTEQWPLRASMIVLQHDQSNDALDDSVSLQSVYESVRSKLSCLREAAPLLELDRDERKLDAFLHLHKTDLLVADLRIFLPFTINLDPYLRKVLKEDQQALFEDEGPIMIHTNKLQPHPSQQQQALALNTQRMPLHNSYISQPYPMQQINTMYTAQDQQNLLYPTMNNHELFQRNINNAKYNNLIESINPILNMPSETSFSDDILKTNLSDLSVDGVINLIERIEDLRPTLTKLSPILKDNAINGRVLKHCDLNELKAVLGLNFGYWNLFRLLISTLRDCENYQKSIKQQQQQRKTSFSVDVASNSGKITDVTDSHVIVPNPNLLTANRKPSQMEKQVTLEEQMICGALSTLNEEAFEDVVSSERPNASGLTTDEVETITLTNAVKSSPIAQIRRDSILKQSINSGSNHSNAAKMDKRVSIKPIDNKNISSLEYVSEKNENKLPTLVEKRSKSGNAGPRPASLIVTKNEKTHFKLMRSSSIDFDDIDSIPNNNKLEQEENENSPLVNSDKKS